MATTTSESDLGVGLGILFAVVGILAALATAYFGYAAATDPAAGHAVQVNGGIAFGVAVLAGILAIVSMHLYER